MNILFYIGTMGNGGAECVASVICNYFVKNNKVVLVNDYIEKSSYKLDKRIDNEFLGTKSDKQNNAISRTLKRIFRLRKVIKEANPDIMISFLPEPSFRMILANILNRRKIIVSVRNDPKIEYNSTFKKFLVKLLYRRANFIVFQTAEARDWFGSNFYLKSAIIPNPISENFVNAKICKTRKNKIVSVGRLEHQKNHKLLIDAFSKITNLYPDYILEIYGEGSLHKELQEQIDHLGLTEKAFLKGQCNELVSSIKDARVFVLSSNYEGMPNALMEAMALGIPCISSDCPCGGPREIIKAGINGLLFGVGDIDDLVRNLEKLICDDMLCKTLSDNAITIRELYSIDIIMKKWRKYTEEIIKGAPK